MIENKKIRKRRRSSSECLAELIDTMLNSPMPILTPADRIETVVVNLRAVIDALDRNFTSAKSLILKLARLLDETKECRQSQICTKIKEMLADKIKEGKITKKWIERCLPQEYRRRYAKSEQSSLSGKAKNLEKIIIVDNKGKTIAVEEEPSPYNSSTIDNNSAFTQPQGRDAIQPIQESRKEYWKVMMVMKLVQVSGIRRRSTSQSADQRSLNTYWHQLKSSLQFLRKDTKK